MDKAISTSSYAFSGVTAAGGMLSLNNIALLAGIFFAALTFLLNVWYQRRKARIAEELAQLDREFHEARMASLVENVCEAVNNLSETQNAKD
ncbi:HP1 family phage holin [Aliidiomarina maris]|nr:HP1 family phage holin [Aliidiomarina maris]